MGISIAIRRVVVCWSLFGVLVLLWAIPAAMAVATPERGFMPRSASQPRAEWARFNPNKKSGKRRKGPRITRQVWRGGFETGSFSQWNQLDGNLSDQSRYFGIVTSPVVQGRYAFRSTVDDGAVGRSEAGGRSAGQRAMVLLFPGAVASENSTGAFEGGERWYRTRIYFPSHFHPSPKSAWNWVVQWHNWPNGPCCSNLALSVDARKGREKLRLRVMGGGDEAHPVNNNDIITGQNPAGHLNWFTGDKALKRQHWYDSVVHVKWSADRSKGLVEWWLDGKRIVSRSMSTLYWYSDNNTDIPGASPGSGQAYYMEGYYRPAKLPNGKTDTSSATVFFDGAQFGESSTGVTR